MFTPHPPTHPHPCAVSQGILRVEYALEDYAAVGDDYETYGPLARTLELPQLAHAGLPMPMIAIFGLELRHGHSYRLRFTATNYIGLTGEHCYSTPLMVDVTPPDAGVVLLLQHDDDNDAEMPTPSHFQYSLQVRRLIALRRCICTQSTCSATHVTPRMPLLCR